MLLEKLGMAYRKAKVDIYYMGNPCLLQLQEYEENLEANLKSLGERLSSPSDDWLKEESFLGAWSVIPKEISCQSPNSVFSDPEERWRKSTEEKRPTAEFRLMAKPSIDFLIFSTLWVSEVGHKYDERLSSNAYGSRLRRTIDGQLNNLALGTFSPYQGPYRKWRDGGVSAMLSALEDDKSIVAITADVESFYHKLDPSFLLREDFLKAIGLALAEDEKRITEQFVFALAKWAERTPLKKGLPVGLPASALIANMALINLDELVRSEVVPLYYGRYVDDIILVMENGSKFGSKEQVWEWVFSRLNPLLTWIGEDTEFIELHDDTLAGSIIKFSNKKNKLLFLEGESGKLLIHELSTEIAERASEWRALPCLSDKSRSQVEGVSSINYVGEGGRANSLFSESLSLQRSSFAIVLRDFEAYERDLLPEAWVKNRHEFLQVFIQNILSLPAFFRLAQYLPRVIRLATSCEDFSELKQIINKVNKLFKVVGEDCSIKIKSDKSCCKQEEILKAWKKYVEEVINENIKASFPIRVSKKGKQIWESKDLNLSLRNYVGSIKDNQACQQKLFAHDLAHTPLRFIGLPSDLISKRGIPYKKYLSYFQGQALVKDEVWSGLSGLAKRIKCYQEASVPFGLLFATRPFTLAELSLLYSESPCSDELSKSILALRGFSVIDKMPTFINGSLEISFKQNNQKLNIAIASWKTDIKSWVASVTNHPDPDLSRYHRITQLLNNVMQCDADIHYLILPELSLPAQWFLRFSEKLRGRGITLISGIEYLHRRNKKVNNQVWAALPHDGLGFTSSMIYRQDKQRPALYEESEIYRLAGKRMLPSEKWNTPPIIKHGSFHFAMLVCSELTNIAYRTSLRGKVDALFVPEWNQDIETFNALVESAALDIHAYVIQCNDRQYGDSRIRAPYQEQWKRDVVRLKGGVNDYFVVGQINVGALRSFQSSHRSDKGGFKPVPDGFSLDFSRKTLPRGGEGIV